MMKQEFILYAEGVKYYFNNLNNLQNFIYEKYENTDKKKEIKKCHQKNFC